MASVGARAVAALLLLAAACARNQTKRIAPTKPTATPPVHVVERVLLEGQEALPAEGGGVCGCRAGRLAAVDAAGRTLVYVGARNGRRAVYALALTGGEPRLVVEAPHGHDVSSPAVSPGGAVAWLASDSTGAQDVRIFDPATSSVRDVTTDGERKAELVFAGEGHLAWHQSRLATLSSLTDEVMLADLRSGTSRRLGHVAASPVQIAVSTRGTHVAMLATDDMGCATCRWYAQGYGVIRLFETATATERLALEGDFAGLFPGVDDGGFLALSGGFVFSRDGRRLSAAGSPLDPGRQVLYRVGAAGDGLDVHGSTAGGDLAVEALAHGWISHERRGGRSREFGLGT